MDVVPTHILLGMRPTRWQRLAATMTYVNLSWQRTPRPLRSVVWLLVALVALPVAWLYDLAGLPLGPPWHWP